jgi:predicted RNA polymerase sigma factor
VPRDAQGHTTHPQAQALCAATALTLRTLGGLTTEEIARAFLVGEATMAQRLVRADAAARLAPQRPLSRRRHRAAGRPGPAVAVSEAEGPEAGLALADRLTGLDEYRYLHSSRGEMLRLGRMREAREAHERAIALAHDEAERRLFQRRLAEFESVPR